MDQEEKKSSLWHEGLFTTLSKDWTEEQKSRYVGEIYPHEEIMADLFKESGISKYRLWLYNNFITRLIEEVKVKRMVKEFIRKNRKQST